MNATCSCLICVSSSVRGLCQQPEGGERCFYLRVAFITSLGATCSTPQIKSGLEQLSFWMLVSFVLRESDKETAPVHLLLFIQSAVKRRCVSSKLETCWP